MRPWISVKEARERLGNAVGLSTIYGWLDSGKLKGTQLGRRRLVDANALDAMIKEGGWRILRRRKAA